MQIDRNWMSRDTELNEEQTDYSIHVELSATLSAWY